MVQKLNKLSVAAYVWGAKLARDMKNGGVELARSLKEDERGISGIVVAALLILVAVLAVVMLWGSLQDLLGTIWGDVTDGVGLEGSNTIPTGG